MESVSKSLALVLVVVILFMLIYYYRYESFNIPKSPEEEYIPQNMGVGEFKEINKWDYPGYMNVTASKNMEKFDNIYPGDRYDLNCEDADWMGVGGQCNPFGPYPADPRLRLGSGLYYLENFTGKDEREDIDCISDPSLAQCQYPGHYYG